MINLTDGVNSIDLPNPILGDADQYATNANYKITMSGNIHSTKQNKIISTFLLTFDNLRQSKYEELISWIELVRGNLLTYTDYNSDTFDGYIKNQPLEVTIDGRRYCDPAPDPVEFEKASVTIEFEAQRP